MDLSTTVIFICGGIIGTMLYGIYVLIRGEINHRINMRVTDITREAVYMDMLALEDAALYLDRHKKVINPRYMETALIGIKIRTEFLKKGATNV